MSPPNATAATQALIGSGTMPRTASALDATARRKRKPRRPSTACSGIGAASDPPDPFIDWSTFWDREVYQLGDHDSSGVNAWQVFSRRVTDFVTRSGGECSATCERLAVTPEQIETLDLPTRPTKQSDTRAHNLGRMADAFREKAP